MAGIYFTRGSCSPRSHSPTTSWHTPSLRATFCLLSRRAFRRMYRRLGSPSRGTEAASGLGATNVILAFGKKMKLLNVFTMG